MSAPKSSFPPRRRSRTAASWSPAARVKATIVGDGRGEKILVFKFKRKKQYKRTIGHRQNFTEVKVGEIVV